MLKLNTATRRAPLASISRYAPMGPDLRGVASATSRGTNAGAGREVSPDDRPHAARTMHIIMENTKSFCIPCIVPWKS